MRNEVCIIDIPLLHVWVEREPGKYIRKIAHHHYITVIFNLKRQDEYTYLQKTIRLEEYCFQQGKEGIQQLRNKYQTYYNKLPVLDADLALFCTEAYPLHTLERYYERVDYKHLTELVKPLGLHLNHSLKLTPVKHVSDCFEDLFMEWEDKWKEPEEKDWPNIFKK